MGHNQTMGGDGGNGQGQLGFKNDATIQKGSEKVMGGFHMLVIIIVIVIVIVIIIIVIIANFSFVSGSSWCQFWRRGLCIVGHTLHFSFGRVHLQTVQVCERIFLHQQTIFSSKLLWQEKYHSNSDQIEMAPTIGRRAWEGQGRGRGRGMRQ